MYVPGREVSVGEVPYLTNSRVWTVFHISLVAEQGRGPRQVWSECVRGAHISLTVGAWTGFHDSLVTG